MVQIHDVNAAEQRCTSRITNVKKEIENRVETLDAKVSKFRDEHEKKLNELQSSNNDQVEIIKNNEKQIEEIVKIQQEELNKLKEANYELIRVNTKLLKNQLIMAQHIEDMTLTYRGVTKAIIMKLDNNDDLCNLLPNNQKLMLELE